MLLKLKKYNNNSTFVRRCARTTHFLQSFVHFFPLNEGCTVFFSVFWSTRLSASQCSRVCRRCGCRICFSPIFHWVEPVSVRRAETLKKKNGGDRYIWCMKKMRPSFCEMSVTFFSLSVLLPIQRSEPLVDVCAINEHFRACKKSNSKQLSMILQ